MDYTVSLIKGTFFEVTPDYSGVLTDWLIALMAHSEDPEATLIPGEHQHFCLPEYLWAFPEEGPVQGYDEPWVVWRELGRERTERMVFEARDLRKIVRDALRLRAG